MHRIVAHTFLDVREKIHHYLSSTKRCTQKKIGSFFLALFGVRALAVHLLLPHGVPLVSRCLYCYALRRWWHGTVVERRSLAGELSLSCARPAADG